MPKHLEPFFCMLSMERLWKGPFDNLESESYVFVHVQVTLCGFSHFMRSAQFAHGLFSGNTIFRVQNASTVRCFMTGTVSFGFVATQMV